MNISEQTINELSEMYNIAFYDDYMNEVQPAEACEMSILSTKEFDFLGKTIKGLKKEITTQYVLNKLNAEYIYQNFTDDFKKLLPLKYKNSINIYPTTYGIGVFVLFNYRGQNEQIQKEIESILKRYNIDYTNEFSNARYVYRYKISKSKENIKKLSELK